MFQRIHDPQGDLRMLDETRRFYFQSGYVMKCVGARLDEMRRQRDVYSAKIDNICSKHGIDRAKAVARIAKNPYLFAGVSLTEQLAEVVRTVAWLNALEAVIDQYDYFAKIVADPSCKATGTLLARTDVGLIAITGSEYKMLTTIFDRERFEQAVGDSEPMSAMGVATALGPRPQRLGPTPFWHPDVIGYGQPEPAVGLEQLASLAESRD